MSALTGARAGACVGRSTSRRLTHAMTSGRTQGVLVTRANHLAFRAAQGVRGATCLRTCINQEQAQRNAVKQDTTCRVKVSTRLLLFFFSSFSFFSPPLGRTSSRLTALFLFLLLLSPPPPHAHTHAHAHVVVSVVANVPQLLI